MFHLNFVQTGKTPNSRRKHDVTCLVTPDVVGLGLPSDNFQPIASFVSIAMLGNEILVGVTFLRYGGKRVTCLREYVFFLNFDHFHFEFKVL